VLSGAVAQVGVDLVLYHGNIGLRHVYVSGDESAISFALSQYAVYPSSTLIISYDIGQTDRLTSLEHCKLRRHH
jgi:hypothetical protein